MDWNVGCRAFGGCVSLSSIGIPGTVVKIECHVFDGCENLAGVLLGEGIVMIFKTIRHLIS